MTLGSIDDLIAPGRREAGRRALAEAFGPGAAIVAEPLAGGASGAAVLRLEVAGGRYVLRLDAAQSLAVTQGRQIVLEHPAEPGKCALQADDGRLLALVERDDSGRISILRGFNLPPP